MRDLLNNGGKMPTTYQSLEWHTFEYTLEFLEPAFFDEFIGAVLRSALGFALKNTVDDSTYRYLFNTSQTEESTQRRYSAPPRPFIVSVHPQGQAWMATGEDLRFYLTLVGKSVSYFSSFFEAFRRMGERGIGLHRSKFALARVESIGINGKRCVIYNEDNNLYNEDFISIQLGELQNHISSDSRQALLTFITPVRLKVFGKLVNEHRFTYEVYMRRLLERICALGYFHCDMPWFDLDNSMIEQMQSIRTENRLHWQEWEFFVNRQPQRIGGLVGQVLLSGELGYFNSIMQAAQWLHVGKNTSYGFGSVSVQ